MTIIVTRPGGRVQVQHSTAAPPARRPAPQPRRSRMAPATRHWLFDERHRGRTDQVILDTKIALARERGLLLPRPPARR